MRTIVRILALVAILAETAIGKPVLPQPVRRHGYAIKERHNTPRSWTRIGPAPGDAVISLNIGLRMSKWEELERHLYEVSDPFHARYGQHLTASEIKELVKPEDKALDAVQKWLEEHGYSAEKLTYSPAKDWVKVSMPLCDAERLLDTKYSVYRSNEGTEVMRTPEWSLPLDLHEHVMAVQPTNSFLRASPKKRTFKPILDPGMTLAEMPDIQLSRANLANKATTDINEALVDVSDVCDAELVTTQCLRTLYQTVDYTPTMLDQNSIAFTNYLNETAMLTDVNTFLTQFRPDAAGAQINFTIINDGNNNQNGLSPEEEAKQQNAEGNLDGETIIGMVHPMRVSAYNTGGSPPFEPDENTPTNTNEPYLDWLNFMLEMEDSIPQVISTSYGDDEQTVPQSYATAVCQKFAELGARGVTLLFASGDNGVGANGACVSNDGRNTTMFLPSFPASCPYVTVVGGTKEFAPEVAAFDPRNDYASGGGFSNYFDMPAYQTDAVGTYMRRMTAGNVTAPSFAGLFNPSGRAYPDLAAQGQSYAVVWNGRNIALDGTSASTPTMASVVALLNDHLVANGRSVMGFMNPWLYMVGNSAFTDVTSGSARGCDGEGFPAREGWDAVTGFGTPDFKKLQEVAMQSPNSPSEDGFIDAGSSSGIGTPFVI